MFTIGTGGTITGGDPSVPTPPTAITPAWLQMIQAELLAIVVAASLTPDPGNSGQVLAAIQQLISQSNFALASDAETVAGQIANKAVTPHGAMALVLAQVGAVVGGAPAALNTLKKQADAIGDDPNFATTVATALAARAMAARLVGTTGLVTGGGDLTGDRTLNVIAASVADFLAGTATDRALTPASLGGAGGSNANGHWSYLPGGALMQWGVVAVAGGGSNVATGSIVFPTPFPNACESLTGNSENASGTWAMCAAMFPGGPTLTGSSVSLDTGNADHAMNGSKRVWWKALGR